MASGVSETRPGAGATPAQQRGRRPATGAPAGGATAGRPAQGVTTAIVLATAPADDGGPAAALPWERTTLLGRLLEQLAGLGVRRAHVLTRTAWEATVREALPGFELPVRVHAAPGVAGDLATVAEVARASRGGVVLAYGDLVTHREALAGLLADPRVVTGILTRNLRRERPYVFRTRSTRGRVVSAASAYHAVGRANAAFLGVLKVDARDRPALVDLAERLAALAAPPLPAGWEEELERKAGGWRQSMARATLRRAEEEAALAAQAPPGDGRVGRRREGPEPPPAPPTDEELAAVVLSPEEEAELRRRRAVAPEDAASLLLVGLVRSGVHLSNSYLRQLFWARPLDAAAVAQAAEDITGYDEDRVLLESAVKGSDGFFTTFFVSPYSKYIARWAARRGLTPNLVTTVSMAIGLLAAAAFATGARAGLVAGAILLQLAFTADCVDGQLARYSRRFSKLGAWLDSVFDRAKEYAVFAGLALGSSRGFGDDVWILAAAALTLQTVRHMFDFSFAATQHQAIATAPRVPLEQPSDTAGDDGHAPAVLPTSPGGPDGAAARRPAAAAPAPSPIALAGAVPDPPPEPVPPLARRVVGGLAGRAFALSRLLERWPWTRWLKKIVAFPIGERFAVISITAAVATPRTTFVVVLAWGGLAVVYALGGRLLRSVAR